jgi:hypothetical protein
VTKLDVGLPSESLFFPLSASLNRIPDATALERLPEMKFIHRNFAALGLLFVGLVTGAATIDQSRVELHPRVFKTNDALAIEFWSGKERMGLAPPISPAGIRLRLPGGGFTPILFTRKSRRGDSLLLGPTQVGNLSVKLRLKRLIHP